MAEQQGIGAGFPPNFLAKQLSRFPVGLLRYFGIPSGQNPQEINPQYQPMLDLWEWLSMSQGNFKIFTSPGVAVGGAVAGTVQLIGVPNMIWVREYSVRCQPIPAGGGDFAIVPTLEPVNPGGGVELVIGPVVRTIGAGAASAGEVVTCRAADPLFCGLGDRTSVTASAFLGIIRQVNTVAGAFQAFGSMRYVDLSGNP